MFKRFINGTQEARTMRLLTAVLLCGIASGIAGAQPAPEGPVPAPRPAPQERPDAPAPQPEDASEEAFAPETPDAPAGASPGEAQQGDVILLENGSQMDGVQVVRENPVSYVVEIVEGVTMELPRTQVKSIVYDDIDPLAERLRRARERASGESDEILAQKLDPAFNEKLNDPYDAPLDYVDMDMIEIVQRLAERKAFTVEVSDAVKGLPPAERQWTVRQEPGVTTLQVLRNPFQERFPNLRVRYEFNKVRIVTAEEAKAVNEEEGGMAGDAATTGDAAASGAGLP